MGTNPVPKAIDAGSRIRPRAPSAASPGDTSSRTTSSASGSIVSGGGAWPGSWPGSIPTPSSISRQGAGISRSRWRGSVPRPASWAPISAPPCWRRPSGGDFPNSSSRTGRIFPSRRNSFDALTVGFGLRNMSSWPTALREMRRVVRPDGPVVVLDFSLPRPPLAALYRFYLHRILRASRMLTGEKDAYQYLSGTIETFPSGQDMVDLFLECGYASCTHEPLSGGIAAIYVGLENDNILLAKSPASLAFGSRSPRRAGLLRGLLGELQVGDSDLLEEVTLPPIAEVLVEADHRFAGVEEELDPTLRPDKRLGEPGRGRARSPAPAASASPRAGASARARPRRPSAVTVPTTVPFSKAATWTCSASAATSSWENSRPRGSRSTAFRRTSAFQYSGESCSTTRMRILEGALIGCFALATSASPGRQGRPRTAVRPITDSSAAWG